MNRELNRAFLHEFISENYPTYNLQANDGIMVNDADIVCQIAIDFQAHIESLKTIADEYVRMLALFVSMNRVWVPLLDYHLFPA